MGGATDVMNPAHGFYIAEADAGTFLVRSYFDSSVEEVVTWSLGERGWACTCGDRPNPASTVAASRCGHIHRVGYELPYDVAMALVKQVIAGRAPATAAAAKKVSRAR